MRSNSGMELVKLVERLKMVVKVEFLKCRLKKQKGYFYNSAFFMKMTLNVRWILY